MFLVSKIIPVDKLFVMVTHKFEFGWVGISLLLPPTKIKHVRHNIIVTLIIIFIINIMHYCIIILIILLNIDYF